MDHSDQGSLNCLYSDGSSYKGHRERLIPWGRLWAQVGVYSHSLESPETRVDLQSVGEGLGSGDPNGVSP